MPSEPSSKPLDSWPVTRRQALVYGPISLFAFAAACSDSSDSSADETSTEEAVAGENCDVVAFPQFQAGPFYLNTGDVRRDVTEGLVGAPMVIALRLIDAATCAPLTDMAVDIWSAGPDGAYSGVDNALVVDGAPDTRGETFMRGRQITDSDGRVEFQTLFPGWYPVTAPHFHFTSPFDSESSFTWQFFIDDDFSETVYTTVAPYSERGTHTVRSSDRSPDLIITPTGTPANPVIDATVAIDLSDLSDTPSEFS